MTTHPRAPVAAPSPPPRGPGARALTWTGAIVGGVLLLSGALQRRQPARARVRRRDDRRRASASYDAAPVVELVADGHVTVTTGGDRRRGRADRAHRAGDRATTAPT